MIISIKDSKVFKTLISVTSLLLASTAAYFGVLGFGAISGGSTEVMIIAGILEFSKIVTVTLLFRYKDIIGKVLKTYLYIGVITLMLFTSIGIYGFLTDTFQHNIENINNMEMVVDEFEFKKEQYDLKISNIEEQLNNLLSNQRTLEDSRHKRETSIAQLYETENFYSARRSEGSLKELDKKIDNNNIKIENLQQQQFAYRDSLVVLTNNKNLQQQQINISGDVGALTYLSNILEIPIDRIFNYYILLIIIVFDPLAIALIISSNWIHKYQIEVPIQTTRESHEQINTKEIEEEDINKVNTNEEEVNKEEDINKVNTKEIEDEDINKVNTKLPKENDNVDLYDEETHNIYGESMNQEQLDDYFKELDQHNEVRYVHNEEPTKKITWTKDPNSENFHVPTPVKNHRYTSENRAL